jgi:hypothetical protein
MTRKADDVLFPADIIGTSVVNGEIRAKLGYWDGTTAESLGISQQSPVWSSFGFDSRAADPDINGACMASCTTDGDEVRVSGSRDLRMSGKLPDLKPGESRMYGYAGQWQRMHQDGRITWMTTDQDGNPDGNAIYLQLHPGYGLIFDSPWFRITAGKYGFHAIDKGSGSRFDMGSVGGLPGALAALSSYIQISTPGVLKLEGAAIALGGGTTPGAANEISVTALQTYITAVDIFAAAVGVIVASLIPASGVTAGQLTTFATALTALQTAGAAANAAVINLGKPI